MPKFKTKKKGRIDWGFDLTDFGTAKRFKEVLKENHIPEKFKVEPRGTGDYGYQVYVWETPDVRMVTGNNAITGEYSSPKYSSPKQRENEKGYASYIGIKGKPEKVMELAKSIRKKAKYVKEENPMENPYIN